MGQGNSGALWLMPWVTFPGAPVTPQPPVLLAGKTFSSSPPPPPSSLFRTPSTHLSLAMTLYITG